MYSSDFGRLVFLCSTLFAGVLFTACGDPAEESNTVGDLVDFSDGPASSESNGETTSNGVGDERPGYVGGMPMQPEPLDESMAPRTGSDGIRSNKVCQAEFDDEHLYSFSARSLTREEVVRMCEFEGQAVLFVNTAANCGFTPQLTALETLHRSYRGRPLTILGFLTNDFANQGGTLEDVEQCTSDYMVTFEQFYHIGVNPESRDGQDPIYRWLTSQPGFEGPIEWNFGKILVSHDGEVLGRWTHLVEPNHPDFLSAVEAAVSAAPLALSE